MKYTLTTALLLCLLTTAVSAHHSIAMYDAEHLKTLEGTVKAFNWINPHSTLEFAVESGSGAPPTVWIVEMSSPGVLTRSGWTKRSFQPGDHVQVVLAPFRDGRPGGMFRRATLPDGRTLTWSF